MREIDYRWDNNEYKAIQRVIKSGCFTMGKEVKEYEENIAEYFNRKYAVMVNSGSSANLIAVAAMIYSKKINLFPGDEVIVPTVSWATTYAPLQQYGLKLIFVDVSEKNYNLNIDILEKAITERTKLVVAVNLLGNALDYERLNKIIQKKGLYLMVDNCESIGGKFNNRHLEEYGIIATISTFFSHHINTMEGGVALTDSEEIYNIMKSIRSHGWTRNTCFSAGRSDFYSEYTFLYPGYNVRPLEIEAAIGKCQLKKLNKFIEIRRKNAQIYKTFFENHKYVKIQSEEGESSWFGFAFILKEEAPYSRDSVIKQLEKQGIESRPIVAGDFLKNPAIKYFDYMLKGEDRVAKMIHERGFFIYNDILDMSERFDILDKILGKK